MRALAALMAVAVIAACTAPAPSLPTPSPSAEPGVLTVTALLDLSGTRGNLGAAQRNALTLWADQNSARKIPVRIKTVDVAGSAARLLIELRRAAEEDRADAVLVGSAVRWDDTLAKALEVAQLPVLFTMPLPSDPVRGTGGRWAFALAPSLPALAAAMVEDQLARGVRSPSLLLSDEDEPIDPFADATEAELARRGLDRLTRIAIPADGAVPPVVRSGLTVVRSIECTAPVALCAPVARAAEALSTPTFFYLSYATTPADVRDERDLAARAVWPSSRGLAQGPRGGLLVDPLRGEFVRTYTDRFGAPGAQASTAFDALGLLAAAADKSGADDRAALRDALERITMPLIATSYSFAVDRHAGADPDDLAFVRWTGSVLVLAPASQGTGIATPTPSPVLPSPTVRP